MLSPESKKLRAQSDKIWQLFRKDKYAEAREYILELMKTNPDDHFLLDRLSNTYYEERNYTKALEYVQKALDLAPYCPMVLWDYAGTLDMLDHNEEAIRLYKQLVRRGVSRIARGACSEGLPQARALVNDCRYRLALIYGDKGDFTLAKKYMREHIKHRYHNCTSIYDLREVKKDLKLVLEGKHPRRV